MIPYQLEKLNGENGNLKSIVIKDFNNNEKYIDADFLLPFYGLSSNLGPIKNWGLKLQQNHVVIDPATGETSKKGIFAAGDIAVYFNKIKLILSGFYEITQAARSIYKIVNSKNAKFF